LTKKDLDQLNSDIIDLVEDHGMVMGGIFKLCDEEEANEQLWPAQWVYVGSTLVLFGLGFGLLMTYVWLAMWIVR